MKYHIKLLALITLIGIASCTSTRAKPTTSPCVAIELDNKFVPCVRKPANQWLA